MARLIWSTNALTDLKEIGEFIALDSPMYAEVTVKRLFGKVEILVEFPKMGRIVPELDHEDTRELIEGNYRIIYELNNEEINILTVHHSARRLRVQ